MVRDERASRAVAGVNHLEIPAELGFILSKLDDWPGSPGAVARAPASAGSVVVPPASHATRQLPADVDQHAFSKFTSIYFKSHVWGMKREPIRTPFLAKASDAQNQESLSLFKLVRSEHRRGAVQIPHVRTSPHFGISATWKSFPTCRRALGGRILV